MEVKALNGSQRLLCIWGWVSFGLKKKKGILKKLFEKSAEWKYFRRVSQSEGRWGFIYLHAEMMAGVKSSSNDEIALN